jgi:hypothetical protein
VNVSPKPATEQAKPAGPTGGCRRETMETMNRGVTVHLTALLVIAALTLVLMFAMNLT